MKRILYIFIVLIPLHFAFSAESMASLGTPNPTAFSDSEWGAFIYPAFGETLVSFMTTPTLSLEHFRFGVGIGASALFAYQEPGITEFTVRPLTHVLIGWQEKGASTKFRWTLRGGYHPSPLTTIRGDQYFVLSNIEWRHLGLSLGLALNTRNDASFLTQLRLQNVKLLLESPLANSTSTQYSFRAHLVSDAPLLWRQVALRTTVTDLQALWTSGTLGLRMLLVFRLP